MAQVIKITDPTGKADGRKAGLDFNDGVAYTEQPLNEGQIAGLHRWGFKIEGQEVKLNPKADGDAVLKAETKRLDDATRIAINPPSEKPAGDKGGK